MTWWKWGILALAALGALSLVEPLVNEARQFPGRVRFASDEAKAGRSPFAFDVL